MSRYKNILFLVTVLVLQIIGLAVQVRRPNPNGGDAPAVRLIRYWAIAMMSPLEKFLHGTGSGVYGLWTNYIDLRHVREQNQELRERVGRLQLEQAGLLEDARQGQRLQALLAFKEHYIYTTVPAEVIGTAGTDQARILYIDKGTKDGLKPDMAVITPDGIVGKLKDVFAHTSQVLVISDQTSGAGVLLESTRLRGVLRGNAVGQPQIINMLPDERVKPGERVITSGGDQIYPRGLPVGVVEEVVPDTSNPPYMDIVIKPAANLGHLEELLVITQVSDQMPQKEQRDLAQSAAQGEAAASLQRASDILAERLPGIDEPNAAAGSEQHNDGAAAIPAVFAPLHPPPALHADHFSPQSTPPATALTPGQVVTDPKYPPMAPRVPVAAATPAPAAKPASLSPEPGDEATEQKAGSKTGLKTGQGTGTAAGPATAEQTHRSEASPSTADDAAAPARPVVAKPKEAKAPPAADQPDAGAKEAAPDGAPPAGPPPN